MAVTVIVSMVSMAVSVPMVLVRPDPSDMMVVSFLRRANVRFIADDLFAIFADTAIHVGLALADLAHPVNESVQH